MHRSVLEARELEESENFFGVAAQRASMGETEKVAGLFEKLRVIVCKLRLHSGFNIKKILMLAVTKVARRAGDYSAAGIAGRAGMVKRGEA
jgi:hypothetical protein